MFRNQSRALKAAADAAAAEAVDEVRDSLWTGVSPAGHSDGAARMIQTKHERLMGDLKTTVAAQEAGQDVRCSASVMRGQRCSRMSVKGRTLCGSHVAMGWSKKDESTDSKRSV